MERNARTARNARTRKFTRLLKSANQTQLKAICKLLTAVAAGNDELAWRICADIAHVSVAEYKAQVGK